MRNLDNLTIACQVKKTSLEFEPLLFLYRNRANLDILRMYSLTCPKCDIETPWSVTQYFGWKNKKSKRVFFFGHPVDRSVSMSVSQYVSMSRFSLTFLRPWGLLFHTNPYKSIKYRVVQKKSPIYFFCSSSQNTALLTMVFLYHILDMLVNTSVKYLDFPCCYTGIAEVQS